VAKLSYSAITSLDGYIEDEDGSSDWAEPDEEVHTFINELERPVGTYLYGRRMYETMTAWETDPTLADQSTVMRDFAELWRAADKVVYSKTLETVSTARTRVERDFSAAAVRQMKASSIRDITVGGPELRARPQSRAGRRVSPFPVAHRGGRRQAVTALRCPPRARTSRHSPFRQRHGVPAVRHPNMTMCTEGRT
jgi:dihydrofolate reductase